MTAETVTVRFVLTHAAQVEALKWGGSDAVIELATEELMDLNKGGLEHPMELGFTCFAFDHSREDPSPAFMMFPRAGNMVIDCVVDEEVTAGPLADVAKGRKVIMPRPFTDVQAEVDAQIKERKPS